MLGTYFLQAQIVGESKEPTQLILPPPEKKGPSLLSPKKEKQFLSEDYFNPTIEFKDPKSDINNPPVNFGKSEQFLDANKQYLNRLNRKPEKEKKSKSIQS